MHPYLIEMQARMDHEERLRKAADRRRARPAGRRPSLYRRVAVVAGRVARGAGRRGTGDGDTAPIPTAPRGTAACIAAPTCC